MRTRLLRTVRRTHFPRISCLSILRGRLWRGIVMLPPTLVSLPFKLLLFVLVDGWVLVVQSLIVLFIAAPPLVRAIFRLPQPGAKPKRASTRRKEEVAAK